MASNIDTSGISFTAHYTGEVWNQHGLSQPFLSTEKGQQLYRLGRPFEVMARVVAGVNNEMPLLQRHHIIDHVVETAIKKQGVSQVVEIACGLSPRGVSVRNKFPETTYIEADLPGMAEKKRAILQQQNLLSEKHQVVNCNILTTEGNDTLEAVFAKLDPKKPTLVITEGLVNYFDLPTISGFWKRLAAILKTFPSGHYVSEIYPQLEWHPYVWWTNKFKGLLGRATKANVSLHFSNDQEIADNFIDYGFNKIDVLLPESFYGTLNIPVQRVPSIVRVIHAQVNA